MPPESPQHATSPTSSSPSSSSAGARPRPEANDPCAIEGGYATVPAPTLAALWLALRAGRVGVAEVRTWCALASVEAGLRAAAQSGGRPRTAEPATIDRVVDAYWGAGGAERTDVRYDRRVTRQRLVRLAEAGLAREVSDAADDRAGRQRWATASTSPAEITADADALLEAFRCPRGRALRLPRRWLAGFAQELTLGTFALAVAASFACGWGRGGVTKNNVDRPAWSGRVAATAAARALGVPARTLRAATTKLLADGRLEPMPDEPWAARRWGRRLRVVAGPPAKVSGRSRAHRSRRSGGARRPSAETARGARRAAAPDQTQTRLRRTQTPRPADAAAESGVCRQEVRKPERSRPAPRVSATRRSTRHRHHRHHRDPWQEADLATAAGVGRLYRRLVEVGLIGEGPRDGVRFFAAAVRAREVSRRPVALLRWLVTGGRWHFVTDAQDARGHREWKAWECERDEGLDAAWETEATPARNECVRTNPIARPKSTTGARSAPSPRLSEPPAKPRVSPPVAGVAGRQAEASEVAGSREGSEPTVDQWPDDVRVLVGQVAIGRARGWDLPSIRGRLARRDGWTAARVEAAEAEVRVRGLLGDA